MTARWSPGVLIGVPAVIVLVLALAAVVFYLIRIDFPELAVFAGIVLVLLVGISAAGFYPYKAEYHQFRPVTGQVEKIGKRLVSEGDGMQERYVFRINGQDYGVDDTRASQTQVGDVVSLSCIREWVYASTSGWACRWVAP